MRTSDHAATSQSRHRQRGVSLLPVVVIILLSLALVFATSLLLKTSRGSAKAEITRTNLARVSDAIIAYVAVNGRLPCPADPAALDGRAKPETATTACTNGNGVVPWTTLGIAPEVAEDGWNQLISYRVLAGATGLTQTNGASMVNCDIKVPYGAAQLPFNGLCVDPINPAIRNLDTQYLASKGLQVNNNATILSKGVAYVLISHGETGFGAFFTNGNRLQMPSSTHELANTNAGSPFYQDDHSAPGTDPSAATHFDDILLWMTITELVKKSGLTARDWPDPTPPSFSTQTLQNMNTDGSGHFNASTTSNGDTFSATSTTSDGAAATTLAYGAGAGGRHSSCAWWPTAFNLFNGADRFTLRMYLEFATDNAARAFSGFTVGFLPRTAAINTLLCGDESIGRGLGWDNGNAFPPLGNLPSPRFAVEYDAFTNFGATDPPYNHLAIDFNGTIHGTTASRCSAFGDTYHYFTGDPLYPDCYTGPGSSWLRNGLTRFHRLRIEVTARDSTCPSGEAPRIKVWILPESVCPDGTSDATCLASKQLSQAFVPPTPLPAGIEALNRCVAAPSPDTLFDQLYFGITASNRTGTTDVVYFRNLDAAVY